MRTQTTMACAGLAALLASGGVVGARHQSDEGSARGPFQFTPLPASAACVAGGAGTFPNEQPFLLPPGYVQTILAREGDGGTIDQWDMNTVNETGPHAGRFLYRSHETTVEGMVSVTDLSTGATGVLAQRVYWNRLDGLVWTPWQTLLVGEEMRPERQPSVRDPRVPLAQAGLVFEVDPATGADVPRPALGAKAHEGIRFDGDGNVYGISETAPNTIVTPPAVPGQPPPVPRAAPGGYIFKFTPDTRGDLSTGQLYALKIVVPTGDRTGHAVWLPLDRAAVQIDADVAATAAGATGYGRPEDVEIATSTGNDREGSHILYVAVTDESRVLRIDLNPRGEGSNGTSAFVSNYVIRGGNAPADFTNPDNLALDKHGNLYITEDTSVEAGGMDIWVAIPDHGDRDTAAETVRFASLTDCTGEPSGIYFDKGGSALFVNVLHRAGRDLGVMITRDSPRR